MGERALLVACAAALFSCGAEPPHWVNVDAGSAALGPVCLSGRYWPLGDRGDNHMHPGRDCIGCHTRGGHGPRFSLAGTIYGAAHEADECFGYDSDTRSGPGAEVQVVDATGFTFAIVANRAGNFYTTYPLRFPLRHVQVRGPDGRVQEMGSAVPHGDCNACHTRLGTISDIGISPGRVQLP